MTTVARSKCRAWILQAVFTMVLVGLPQPLSADSADCSADDPSATFSTAIWLPSTELPGFRPVREAIARGDFVTAEKLLHTLPPTSDRWLWEGVLLLQTRETFASIRALEKAAELLDTCTVEALLGLDYLLLNQKLL